MTITESTYDNAESIHINLTADSISLQKIDGEVQLHMTREDAWDLYVELREILIY